jgi:hypothetical protein
MLRNSFWKYAALTGAVAISNIALAADTIKGGYVNYLSFW